MNIATEDIFRRRARCPITGLPVTCREDWVGIRLQDDYKVSFCFLGERILVVHPSGNSPSLDLDRFYATRDAVIEEQLGSCRNFVEIKDYGNLAGAPTRAQRNLQTRKYYDDIGRSLGFFAYNLRPVHEPLFRVGLLLHSPVYPFALKRSYADAALTAAQIVRLHDLQQLRQGQGWVENPRWRHRGDGWEAEIRVGAHLLLLRLGGDLRSAEAESWLLEAQEAIFDASLLGAHGPYYKIFDVAKVVDHGWRVAPLLGRLRELHRRHTAPQRVFIVSASKVLRQAASLIQPLFPYGVELVCSVEEAMQNVEVSELTEVQRLVDARAPFAASGRSGPDLVRRARALLDPVRRLWATQRGFTRFGIERSSGRASRQQIEGLIRDIGRVIWEAPVGDDLPDAEPDHPLRDIYAAFGVMQREIKQLFRTQRRKSDELVVAKQQLEQANRELSEALAETRRLADAAQQAARAKSRFVASMSHEIRTPMNAVMAPLALLREADLEEEPAQLVGLAYEGTLALLGVVDDILDFSKIEAEKVKLEQEDFDVAEALAEVCRLMSISAREKGIELRWTVDATLGTPWLRGDRSRLKQVLLNLISNAIKFTDAGSVEVHALGAQEIPGTALRITVSDTGLGLGDSDVEQLFDPFVQGEATPRHPVAGTGLGLAISRRLVALMGGRLSAEPNEQGGATFWFEVPLAAAEQPRPDPKSSGPPLLTLPPEAEGLRVLIVEDDVTSRRALHLLLRKAGLLVTEAADGQQVFALLQSTRPDLVLMDCQLPEMDGFEVTRAIRRQESQLNTEGAVAPVHLPIIALTANSTDADRDKCLAAGMDEFLSKPVDLARLMATLSSWLVTH